MTAFIRGPYYNSFLDELIRIVNNGTLANKCWGSFNDFSVKKYIFLATNV